MDRKRKASMGDATPSASASKRIKLLNSNGAPAGAGHDVQSIGSKLLGQLNNATDKNGRLITDAFLTLPPRHELPDYYQQTKLPIAIDTIQDKLRHDEYPTLTTLESDLKRMVQNAKDYNMPKSDVFEDAERIRKLVYNFMKVHNPQYTADPNYVSFPTPIPQDGQPRTNGSHSRESSTKIRLSAAPNGSEAPSDRTSSVALSASAGADIDDEDAGPDFTGKTFQEAQQMILAELLRYADEDGNPVYGIFAMLPSRKLEDYYRLIKHPVSIKGAQKRVRGQHGRNDPTGITDFKTWDAFENEVSFIWRNAREYNEDGTSIYELAGEFEEQFKARLAEAKKKVDEPAGPRIKIGAAKAKSGITLNLNQPRASPTPGVTVDSEALARQRQLVQAGAGSQQLQARPSPMVNGNAAYDNPGLASGAPRPLSAAPARSPPAFAIKNEKAPIRSPAPSAAPPSFSQTNGMMPPPLMRPPNGMPYAGPPPLMPNSYHFTAPSALPPTPIRTYPLSQALLPLVTLATHPQLRIPKAYSLAIAPHAALSHQSTTITLPPTHYIVQISPTIHRDLSMGRAYKMFVTVNGTRLTQRDTQFHADSGRRTHVYEGSLASGVNRIEVEVAAAAMNGEGKGLDVEKLTVFANLMRAY